MTRRLTLIAIATLFAAPAFADTLYVSVLDNLDTQIGPLVFRDGDIVRFDRDDPNTAAIFFNEDLFGGTSVDITAFHLLPDGRIVLSVLFNGRTLGGLTFDDGDLVVYDPVADIAQIYFLGEADFSGENPDISAVYVADDGKILLSTFGAQTLRGLSFTDGDIVQYDPNADTATELVDEAAIFDDGDGDIDALHRLSNGHYVFSTATDEVVSGVAFLDGDLIEYDAVADTATLYFSETTYTTTSTSSFDTNAAYIAEDPEGCPAACSCDITGDCLIDLSDLAGLLANFGVSGQPGVAGDCTGDDAVTLEDLAGLLAQFGEDCR